MEGCRVGYGRVELTPDRTGPNTGWGYLGNKHCDPPIDDDQRLYATALALEDGAGQRVVLVAVDLHSGGRHLWRAATEASGLDPSRVIVCGTHTHAGPGQRYGGPMYTLMAGASALRPWGGSNRMAPLVGEAVGQAIRSLTPGGVAVTTVAVDGVASNRALPAWTHYDDETRARFLHEGPGALTDPDAPLPDRCRDPRATVVVARSDDDSMAVALAWYSVHGTSLGQTYPYFGSDLFGFARAEVERDGWVVGWAGGSSGDVSPLPTTEDGHRRTGDSPGPEPDRPTTQGRDLAETVGRRIGVAVAGAARSTQPRPFSLAVAHERWYPRRSGLPRPMTGLAQAGGGLDGPSDQLADVGDGVRAPRYRTRSRHAYPTEEGPRGSAGPGGQGPKLAVVQAVLPIPLPVRLGFLWDLLAPRWVPLHVIRIGDHAIATVPGEPTTMSGWRIEEAVREATGCSSASVAGFAGDYAGYWVTPEEYLEQRYEAAASIFGREAATRLTERLTALAASFSPHLPPR